MPHRIYHPGTRPGLDVCHSLCVLLATFRFFFRCAQKIGYQLSALPCVPTTGRKRKGLGGCLHRFSSTRPDSAQLSHHRYLFTLGSSPKGRTTESLEALQMSLWNVWIHKRHRNHGSRSVTQTRDVWFFMIFFYYMAVIKIQCTCISLVTKTATH